MSTKYTILCCLLALSIFVVCGCTKKADESKPVADVKAEAEQLSVEKLRSMAVEYKDAIEAKKAEVEKFAAKLKDIPLTEMLGEEAKNLKAEIDSLNNSVAALVERFEIYYNKLKEKGGDLSSLEI